MSIEDTNKRSFTPRETQHSMKRRAPWHDYRAPGTYMLTLVVEGRKPLLGRLEVDNSLDYNAVENRMPVYSERSVPGHNMAGGVETVKAHIALSPLGKAVLHDAILKISTWWRDSDLTLRVSRRERRESHYLFRV